ncbi:MAG TPA: hypothetical protein DCZ05_13305 [Deltaproteobacteria bacterium]|nr:hypothetical protein [Deltaproteobacteria bacterium]
MITPRQITCSILSLLLLSSCTLTDSGTPQRVVQVKALGDLKLREENPRWVEEVRGLIEAASDYFEREFGIRFVTQTVAPWPLKDRIPSTPALMSRVKAEVPLKDPGGSYDLVIVFTGERVNVYVGGRARVDRIGDCRQGLGNYLVSSVSGPFYYRGPNVEPEMDVVALIHELGHIFGAEHIQDIGSIMNENFDYRTEFDKKNRAVIFKNKFCPFGKGG